MPKDNLITTVKQLVQTLDEIQSQEEYKKVVNRLNISKVCPC